MAKPVSHGKQPFAEKIVGRRLTPEQEAGTEPAPLMYNIGPTDLALHCPVHPDAPPETLNWSEYEGFVWCELCEWDWPSPRCIDIFSEPDGDPMHWIGRQAIIDSYLWLMRELLERHGIFPSVPEMKHTSDTIDE